MRSDNLNQIKATMLGEPQAIPEIVQKTNLSYSTVQRGLRELNAEAVVGTYPPKWKIAGGSTGPISERPIGPELDGRVAVGIKHVDNLVSKWNGQAVAFGKGISELTIAPTDDPRELAKRFALAASTLANLAYSIKSVSTKPDWFELAGGKLESE